MPTIHDSLRSIDFRRAGFWLNYGENPIRVFLIDDHQRWVRLPTNAQGLGLSRETINQFGSYPFVAGDEEGRIRFLRFILASTPVMRIRGHHGAGITFEYHAVEEADQVKAMNAVTWFCHEAGVGMMMALKVINLVNHSIHINQNPKGTTHHETD